MKFWNLVTLGDHDFPFFVLFCFFKSTSLYLNEDDKMRIDVQLRTTPFCFKVTSVEHVANFRLPLFHSSTLSGPWAQGCSTVCALVQWFCVKNPRGLGQNQSLQLCWPKWLIYIDMHLSFTDSDMTSCPLSFEVSQPQRKHPSLISYHLEHPR